MFSFHACNRLAARLWLLLGLAHSLPAQEHLLNRTQHFRFSLIQIPVWVANRQGVPMPHLDKGDFKLYIDGRPAPFEHCLQAWDKPLELVYLLDISGSMAVGGKLDGSLRTISRLLEEHRPDDRWKLIVFSDGQVVQALDQTTRDLWPELRQRINAYGKTALYDALSTCHQYFEDQVLENRAVLLFTDGNDNQSRLTQEQLFKVLKVLDVPVFIVGIADGFLPSKMTGRDKLGLPTLREIVNITGGELFLVKDAAGLVGITGEIARKLRPQYLLTMTVERGEGDRRHDIRVKLKRQPSYRLRYRQGFIGWLPEPIGGKK